MPRASHLRYPASSGKRPAASAGHRATTVAPVVTDAASYHAAWRPLHETASAPFAQHYPVRLCDGSSLELPLQPLPGGNEAIALLMSNQTSFMVEDRLCERLADIVRDLSADTIVGVPTMGLTYARPVAARLGLPHYVALGLSRKFWYDDALSEPVVSSTSPDAPKRLYIDPALVPRVHGRRVVLVDDVLNTGQTAAASVRLLRSAGAELVGIAAMLTEGWIWRATLAAINPALPDTVHALGHIPIFARTKGGWRPIADTDAEPQA